MRADAGACRTAWALHLFSLAAYVVAAFAKLWHKKRRGQGCIRLGSATSEIRSMWTVYKQTTGQSAIGNGTNHSMCGRSKRLGPIKAKFRCARCRLDASCIGDGFAGRIARAPAACHTNPHGKRANDRCHIARSKRAIVDIAIDRIDSESPPAIGWVFTVRGHRDIGSG